MASAQRQSAKWLTAVLAMALCAAPAAAQQTSPPPVSAADEPALNDLPSVAAKAPEPQVKPVKKPKPRLKPGALPPLKPYRGAERLGLRGGPADLSVDAAGNPVTYDPPSPNVAVPPPPPLPRKIKDDPNPFDPVGLRVNDITLKPYVEENVGYATNPLSTTGAAKGSGLETTEAGVAWASDWSRDDFHGELKGGYADYFSAPSANAESGSGVADLRLDATRDLAFDAEGRFNVAPQSLSSFGLTSSGGSTPYVAVAAYGATVGASDKLGKLTLALHGSLDRESYQDVALFGASAASLGADDYNDYGLKARASYQISEALSPFVEFGYDWRRYDSGADALGYQRDSTGYVVRAGATVDFSQKLTGEASLGYGERGYQDSRLTEARAGLFDAKLVWSPTALTTLTFKAQSALNDSLLAGASADLNRTYTIDVAHSLTRAVTLGLTGTYASDDFLGAGTSQSSKTVAARAEYHVNRHIVLKATASREAFSGSTAGQSYVADVFTLGVRLQE